MKRTVITATILITSALLGLASAQQPPRPPSGDQNRPEPPNQKDQQAGQPMPSMDHPMPPMPPMPVMLVLDADQDGELSAEEIKNASAALLTLDKDDDGKLSGEELAPPPQPGDPRFVQYIMSFDTNSDKKVSKEELPAYLQHLLEVADSSGDKALTQQELSNMNKQQRNPRRR